MPQFCLFRSHLYFSIYAHAYSICVTIFWYYKLMVVMQCCHLPSSGSLPPPHTLMHTEINSLWWCSTSTYHQILLISIIQYLHMRYITHIHPPMFTYHSAISLSVHEYSWVYISSYPSYIHCIFVWCCRAGHADIISYQENKT